jgi:hypothetical protein
MRPEFSRQIFENCSNIKFNDALSGAGGGRVLAYGGTDRQTDMTKLIIAFRDFANASKSEWTGSGKWQVATHSCNIKQ